MAEGQTEGLGTQKEPGYKSFSDYAKTINVEGLEIGVKTTDDYIKSLDQTGKALLGQDAEMLPDDERERILQSSGLGLKIVREKRKADLKKTRTPEVIVTLKSEDREIINQVIKELEDEATERDGDFLEHSQKTYPQGTPTHFLLFGFLE